MTASSSSSLIDPARSRLPTVESATRWTWQSISPGISVPLYVLTSTPSGRSGCPGSTPTIDSPSTSTVVGPRKADPSKAMAARNACTVPSLARLRQPDH